MKSMGLFRAAFFALMAAAAIAPSRTAFADKEGSAYRGKTRCSDQTKLAEVVYKSRKCRNGVGKLRVDFADWPPLPSLETPKLSCLNRPGSLSIDTEAYTSRPLVDNASGKLSGVQSSAWIVADVRGTKMDKDGKYASTSSKIARIEAPNVPALTVTKTGSSQVAINVLVCPLVFPLSYYAAGNESGYGWAYEGKPQFGKEISGRIEHDTAAGAKLRLALPNQRDADSIYVVYVESESRLHSVDYAVSMPLVAGTTTTPDPAK